MLKLIIIFIALNITALAFAEIEIKYDRFKDETIVKTSAKGSATRALSQPAALGLFAKYPGKTLSTPDHVFFVFFITSRSGWQYLDCHSVNCLVDGRPFKFPEFKHDGKVFKNYISEKLATFVPFDTLKKLSTHNKIEFKICNTEFSLTDDEMRDIIDFVNIFGK